jgi:hypothetical protein
MTNFSKWQVMAMIALPLALTTNPMLVEIFWEWYKLLFTGIFIITTAYLVVFLLYKVLKPEKLKVPSKAKKSKVKSSEYISE